MTLAGTLLEVVAPGGVPAVTEPSYPTLAILALLLAMCWAFGGDGGGPGPNAPAPARGY